MKIIFKIYFEIFIFYYYKKEVLRIKIVNRMMMILSFLVKVKILLILLLITKINNIKDNIKKKKVFL